jgi:hypothetical protein
MPRPYPLDFSVALLYRFFSLPCSVLDILISCCSNSYGMICVSYLFVYVYLSLGPGELLLYLNDTLDAYSHDTA